MELNDMSAGDLVDLHNGLVGPERRIVGKWKRAKAELVARLSVIPIGTQLLLPPPPRPAARRTAGSLILELAADPLLSCEDIASRVRGELGGNTSARSVASVISVANRAGANVPKRARPARA